MITQRDRRFFLSLTQWLLGLAVLLGVAGYLLVMPFGQATGPGPVSYTHLTLPTTPYV